MRAILCSLVLLLSTPAVADAESSRPRDRVQPSPSEQVLDGLDRVLRGLERMIEQIPQYDPPELSPDGDIIIRRRHPDASPRPEPGPERPSLRRPGNDIPI